LKTENVKPILQNRSIITGFIFGVLILMIGLIIPKTFTETLNQVNILLLGTFTSFYLWLGFLIVVLSVVLIFLPFSKQRLGNEKAEYSWFSWIALLYSTGMGSGLLLRAVQEPVYYLNHSPIPSTNLQSTALQYTFFHWGLTPWSFYSLFGLIVAHNLYNNKAHSFLEAIIPQNKSKILKDSFNIFIILITIVGVVASLGLGTGQFIGGINSYFTINLGTNYLLFSILFMGIIATLSALTGIQKAIKILADFDMLTSLSLLVFVAFFLDYSHFFKQTFTAFKDYVIGFPQMSLSLGKYKVSDSFLKDWTVFYWAFWLSWVPFTGIFIARISKGRTIRQFLIATILIPTLATVIWFAVFGNKVFEIMAEQGYHQQFNSIFTSLFNFLRFFPFSEFTILITAVLVLIAIINSVDSAIFVISMFSDNGSENPSKMHKLLWGIIITATAIGLTAVGSKNLLNAISNLLIIMAFPFIVFCKNNYPSLTFS
jgi:glycine betaine transporter